MGSFSRQVTFQLVMDPETSPSQECVKDKMIDGSAAPVNTGGQLFDINPAATGSNDRNGNPVRDSPAPYEAAPRPQEQPTVQALKILFAREGLCTASEVGFRRAAGS